MAAIDPVAVFALVVVVWAVITRRGRAFACSVGGAPDVALAAVLAAAMVWLAATLYSAQAPAELALLLAAVAAIGFLLKREGLCPA